MNETGQKWSRSGRNAVLDGTTVTDNLRAGCDHIAAMPAHIGRHLPHRSPVVGRGRRIDATRPAVTRVRDSDRSPARPAWRKATPGIMRSSDRLTGYQRAGRGEMPPHSMGRCV